MSKTNILIVDDSISQRMVLKAKLSNYEELEVVGEAIDGKDALQKYQQLNPDIVILDLVMPKFDGKMALKKILESDSNGQIIIASSLGGEEDVEECLRLGAKAFIQKPYDDDDLIRSIKQIVA